MTKGTKRYATRSSNPWQPRVIRDELHEVSASQLSSVAAIGRVELTKEEAIFCELNPSTGHPRRPPDGPGPNDDAAIKPASIDVAGRNEGLCRICRTGVELAPDSAKSLVV